LGSAWEAPAALLGYEGDAARSPSTPMLALEELTASTCKWPLAEFERGVFLYCGEAVDPSLAPTMRCYCPCHARLAYCRSSDRSSRVSKGTKGAPAPLL
jgi:hypothetical protein